MAAIKNEIYLGNPSAPLYYFDNASLLTASGEYAVDLVGDELSIDRFTPVTRYEFEARKVFKPTDYDGIETADGLILCGYYNENPANVPYGTELWYYANGELVGKFYVEYVQRTAKDKWQINAVSVIGLLDLQYHRGGVYTGKTFAELLVEIFGGKIGTSENGITPITGGLADCYCEDAVAETTVHGLLPYDTKRNNLHQLIFAHCVNMTKDADGDLIFSYLKNTEPELIPKSRIYVGGSVNYEAPVTDIELTEWTYIYDETAEAEDVYNNVSAPHITGEALISFDKPINPETIIVSGSLTVRDANEVSAYVTGNGVITAVPYQVQSRVISRAADNFYIQKTVSVSDVTLVNPLNSTNVMGRLYDYYTNKKTIRSSVVVEGEKPGQLYKFTDPYGEEVSGYFHRMSFNVSSNIKADCEVITDYTPTGASTNMNNFIMLTGKGVWTVPSSVRQRENPYIKVILIGGGQGGRGGYSGNDSDNRPLFPGAGGLGGEGGQGGKILSVDINVSSIVSFAYSCGAGGQGGASDVVGAMGDETTFGNYTTADGAVSPGGIMNMINGKFYGRTGDTGQPGAAGGQGMTSPTATPTNEDLATDGADGEAFEHKGETWGGGAGGKTVYRWQNNRAGWAFGAGGGGAAYGADGENGGDGYVQWGAVIGGTGGTGATATVPGEDAQYTGCGGNGGHGGGGGGAPGDSAFSQGSADTGHPGKGGQGSQGGKGAPGGILIYY